MAQATVELRNLLKTDFELFDFDYNFSDREFAKEIEESVINFYWNYEIGQETPDDFKRAFKRRWLNMIGYYDDLYRTTKLEYNPLTNYQLTDSRDVQSTNSQTQENTTTAENEASSTSNVTGSENTNERASDYPQAPFSSGSGYLSGERRINSDTSNRTNTSDTSKTDSRGELNIQGQDNTQSERTVEGITGVTYQELIRQERENLIRIKSMIIEELKPCFILVH